MLGCGPSTLTQLYRRLRGDPSAYGLTGKTGTLTTTDGGISVLAGYLPTALGRLPFVVAAPRAGRRQWEARQAIEDWVSERIKRYGVASTTVSCPPPMPYSDEGARLVTLSALPAVAGL